MFYSELRVGGVILNRVASERDYEMLREAIESSCKTRILGWLPTEAAIAIPERHLGLQGAAEQAADGHEAAIDAFALAARHLDLDGLVNLACGLEMAGVESTRVAT